MELRQYWRIIRRRIWLPLLLMVVVAIVSLATSQPPPTTYSASMRFAISIQAETSEAGKSNEQTYYGWVSSEYLADTMAGLVRSEAFAGDVNRHLADSGSAARLGSAGLAIVAAEEQDRILQISLSGPNPAGLNDLGAAIGRTFVVDGPRYVTQLGTPNAVISPVDETIVPFASPPSLTSRLDLPIRLLLALGAGLALVFLLDYLDTSVRDALELEQMDIPVLACIPKQK